METSIEPKNITIPTTALSSATASNTTSTATSVATASPSIDNATITPTIVFGILSVLLAVIAVVLAYLQFRKPSFPHESALEGGNRGTNADVDAVPLQDSPRHAIPYTPTCKPPLFQERTIQC